MLEKTDKTYGIRSHTNVRYTQSHKKSISRSSSQNIASNLGLFGALAKLCPFERVRVLRLTTRNEQPRGRETGRGVENKTKRTT